MFKINEDMSIYITRGDAAAIDIGAKLDEDTYVFRVGDVVRFKVTAKKNCAKVVLQKDFVVQEECTSVEINLSSDDTKFEDFISKPKDYWYEVELNPDTKAQTIIGYDDESGAKIFRLYPEGGDFE